MTRQEAIKTAIEAGWRAASAVFDDEKLWAVPAELGEYICNRGEPTAGETVWRRAAAIGMLPEDAEEWALQPAKTRLAYSVFAETTFTTFEMLRGFGMIEAEAVPRGPPGMADQAGEGGLAEQIFGPVRPMGERLPEHVEALALGAKKIEPLEMIDVSKLRDLTPEEMAALPPDPLEGQTFVLSREVDDPNSDQSDPNSDAQSMLEEELPGAKATRREMTQEDADALGAALSRDVYVSRVRTVGERPVVHRGERRTGGARPSKEEQPDD